MGDIIKFQGDGGASDGGGPTESMLEQRVARLESDVKDVRSLLQDQQRVLTDIQVKLGAIEGRIGGLDAKLDGRISGLEMRIASLPNTWTMLGIVFTTWAIGSGILIVAMNAFRP